MDSRHWFPDRRGEPPERDAETKPSERGMIVSGGRRKTFKLRDPILTDGSPGPGRLRHCYCT